MSRPARLPLRSRVICPHCWERFAPEEVLWISGHPDLRGDRRIGPDAAQRFLPTRFTVEGQAIDTKGVVCRQLACPQCHLSLPRVLMELEPLFLSILGTPSSGKSYYLASMTWGMRQRLSSWFGIHFADADPYANQIINDYEEQLFLSEGVDQLVTLPKTELQGDLYESVQFEDRVVHYPRPFVFTLQPAAQARGAAGRAMCLYDNAGEHFLPGGETLSDPGTQHLSVSRALLFLFDPTQHRRFRQKCRASSRDPQLHERAPKSLPRQDQVLLEAASRIRSASRLAHGEKSRRPLVVVVTKYDVWKGLLGTEELPKAVVRPKSPSRCGLDVEAVRGVSGQVRGLLQKYAPEVVAAAEGFAEEVVYVPTSATGCSPEVSEAGLLVFSPEQIAPQWAEVPLLYALYRTGGGLIPRIRRRASSSSRRSAKRGDDGRSGPVAESNAKPVSPRPAPGATPDPLWKETGS